MGSKVPSGRTAQACISAGILLLTLVAAEAFTRAYFPEQSQLGDPRLLFFSQGDVVKNTPWGGYTYGPNRTIRSQLYVVTDPNGRRLVKVYDYMLKTNSYGMVQLHDPIQDKPAILLLGDSFTEGQGAAPWFYETETRWPSDGRYQILNGGVFGTGFGQWAPYYRNLSSALKISKVVIIFISDDWIRPLYQLPPFMLECLKSSRNCTGSELLYGIPDDAAEADREIVRLVRLHAEYLENGAGQPRTLRDRIALYRKLIRPIYMRARGYVRPVDRHEEVSFEASRRALTDIAASIGAENMILIHLPQKEELASGPSEIGLKGRDFVRHAGLTLVDGFAQCGLTPSDYLSHDGHPNGSGYHKIAVCVERIVRDAWHLQAPVATDGAKPAMR